MEWFLVLLGLGGLLVKETKVAQPLPGSLFAEGSVWSPVAAGSGAPSLALRTAVAARIEWLREGDLAASYGILYSRVVP